MDDERCIAVQRHGSAGAALGETRRRLVAAAHLVWREAEVEPNARGRDPNRGEQGLPGWSGMASAAAPGEQEPSNESRHDCPPHRAKARIRGAESWLEAARSGQLPSVATLERSRREQRALRREISVEEVAPAVPDRAERPIWQIVAVVLTGIALLVAVEITLAFAVAYLVTGHAY
jgi:hypothetical protein